jgi:hypothetical protein
MKTFRQESTLVIVALMIFSLPGDLIAFGDNQNVRGVGMAKTSAAVSYGLESAGLNPANLALGPDHFLSIGVAPAAFHAGGDVFGYDVYTNFFSGIESPTGLEGRYLADYEKSLIMSRFDGEEFGESFADFGARLLGVSIRLPHAGVLAFPVTDYAGAVLTLPQDLAGFILYGNPLGSVYDLSGTELSAEWIRAYSLSFGAAIEDAGFLDFIAIGGGVKLIHGYAYYEILQSDSHLETSDYGVLTGDVDFLARVAESPTLKATGFDFFPVPAGQGFGFDLGLTAGLTQDLSLGLSITDVGSVTWSGNTEEIYSDTSLVIDNPLDPDQQKQILGAVSGDNRRETDPFSTQLPTKVRIGLALETRELLFLEDLAGNLVLGFDCVKALREGPGSSTDPRFSFGAEYVLLPFLPIRAGIATGGAEETAVAAGFGLRAGPLAIDVATDNVGWIFAPSTASYGSLSVGAALSL